MSSSSIRLAATSDDLEGLTRLINASYKQGEAGIFVDTADEPFVRHTLDEIEQMVKDAEMNSVETMDATVDRS